MSTPALRGALALRGRVLRRRFGSPLEAVALVVGCAIAWRAGSSLGPAVAGWIDLPLLALLVVGVAAARRGLYVARELPLLLTAGLTPRELVLLRGVELAVGLGAGALPILALARGAAGPTAWPLLAAAPLLALGLSGAALALGAGLGRLGTIGRVVAVLGAAGALLALGVGAAPPSPLARGLLELAGGAPAPLGPLALSCAALVAAALLLAPRGHEAGLTRAALRDPSRRAPVWRALAGALGGALGRAAGALLARDLVLLARGALPRGVVVVVALPVVAVLVLLGARTDRTLDPWQVELMALLLVGVLAAAAGFLAGIDLPRARRARLVLERTSPLTGASVARARVAGGVLAGAPALLAAVVVLGLDPAPARAALALPVLAAGLLLLCCVVHDAVGYGLRDECSGDPAAASAYPVRAAPLIVTLGVGLTVHPALGVLYVLFGWYGEVGRAARRWESAEVQPERVQAG